MNRKRMAFIGYYLTENGIPIIAGVPFVFCGVIALLGGFGDIGFLLCGVPFIAFTPIFVGSVLVIAIGGDIRKHWQASDKRKRKDEI